VIFCLVLEQWFPLRYSYTYHRCATYVLGQTVNLQFNVRPSVFYNKFILTGNLQYMYFTHVWDIIRRRMTYAVLKSRRYVLVRARPHVRLSKPMQR
jgi:hypothetical protein